MAALPPTPAAATSSGLGVDTRLAMAALQFARSVPSVAVEFHVLLQALRVLLRLNEGGGPSAGQGSVAQGSTVSAESCLCVTLDGGRPSPFF